MTNKEIKQKLEVVLDEQFPKGKCKERGGALILFAEAMMLLNQSLAEARKEGYEECLRTNTRIDPAPSWWKRWGR